MRLTPPCGAPPNSCGFFALNDTAANDRDFSAANGVAISPGLYELRIATASATTETNVFGVDVRAARSNAAHYDVFTLASDDGSPGAPVVAGVGETAWLAGSGFGSSAGPDGNITQPLMFYAFVDRGCSVQTVELRHGLPRQHRRRRQRRDPRRARSHDRADDERRQRRTPRTA